MKTLTDSLSEYTALMRILYKALPGGVLRDGMRPAAVWHLITPTCAAQLLDLSVGANRRELTERHMRSVANSMQAGTYNAYQGDPVRIDCEGRVIDGQHRLTAIVEAQTSQEVLVLFPAIDYATIDSACKTRRLRDYLRKSEYQYCSMLDTLTRWWFLALTPDSGGHWSPGSFSSPLRVDHEQLLRFFRAHEDALVWSATQASALKGVFRGSLTAVAFAMLQVADRLSSLEIPEAFISAVARLDGAPVGKLFLTRCSGLDAHHIYAGALRCMRMMVDGESMDRLYLKRRGEDALTDVEDMFPRKRRRGLAEAAGTG